MTLSLLAPLMAALLGASAIERSSPEEAVDAGLSALPSADGGTSMLDPSDELALPEEDEEEGEGDLSEGEAGLLSEAPADGGLYYSRDLSDEELARRWVEDLPSLGSISVGFVESGRLINGVALEPTEAMTVVAPQAAFGCQEMVDALGRVAMAVREKHPDAAALRVNHLSNKEGGYLRPHHSHQAGRDADLGFFYKGGLSPAEARGRRESLMDVPVNWTLVRSLVTLSDVQLVLVDKRVKKRLYDYALSAGEDREWLDRVFNAGPASLIRHAPRHRDHFHARFYAGRSQELGRRVQPLLARRPEENVVMHRVRRGDTLGQIAYRWGTTVKMLFKANGLKSSFLSVGRTLRVPLRGPCTRCPMPPPVVIPARVLPPVVVEPAIGAAAPTDTPDAGVASPIGAGGFGPASLLAP